jgi:hypothetical protein
MKLADVKKLKIHDKIMWKKDASCPGEIIDIGLGMIKIRWGTGELNIVSEDNMFLAQVDLLRDTAGLKKKTLKKKSKIP